LEKRATASGAGPLEERASASASDGAVYAGRLEERAPALAWEGAAGAGGVGLAWGGAAGAGLVGMAGTGSAARQGTGSAARAIGATAVERAGPPSPPLSASILTAACCSASRALLIAGVITIEGIVTSLGSTLGCSRLRVRSVPSTFCL
jgi:hypothetical protein